MDSELKRRRAEMPARQKLGVHTVQLFVQRSDGTIESEFTYGPDPHPPKG